MLKEKNCKGCFHTLSIDNFNKSSNIKDGYENKCKECRKAQRKAYHTYNCKNCGKTFSKIVKQEFCSNECSGEFRRMCSNKFKGLVEKTKEYLLITPYITSRKQVIIKHLKCEHEFKVTPNNFMTKGSGCPKCYGNLRKTTIEFKKEVKEVAGNDYTVLGNYVNTKTPILMRHNKCNKEYKVSPDKFLLGRRCPECYISNGEEVIREYLNRKGITFKREHTFDDCQDKRLLPFDFAVFEKDRLIALIEFDGRHHFEAVDIWGGEKELKNIQRRDAIKDEYCKANNIKLIRIPHYKINEVQEILDKKLPMTIPSEAYRETVGTCND